MSKIDKPGRYDLSMDEYHGDVCVGPSLSASRLHTLIAECPAIFWETSPLNPKRVDDKSTSALDIGRAAHALVLGEPEFRAHFVVLPEDVPNRPSKRQRSAKKPSQDTLDAIEFWDGVFASKKTIVPAEAFKTIVAMADAQRRSPQVARAFTDGAPEQSLIWLDEETGIFLKSRPDWLPDDPASRPLTQYKTCRSIEPRKLSMDAFSYGYHIGAALELDAVQAVLGVKPIGICHVCQEKTIPYLAELRMFDGDGIEWGRREYRRALRLFAKCWEKHLAGKPEREAWPGFTDGPEYFDTPFYIRKKMESPDGDDGTSEAFERQRQYDAAEYVGAG